MVKTRKQNPSVFIKNARICIKLAERDVRQPYYKHLLGPLWIYLYPLFMAAFYFLVFTFLMGSRPALAGATSHHAGLVVFSSLVFWLYISDATSRSISAYSSHSGLVRQLHFPYLTIPLSQPLAAIPAFLPGLLLVEIFAFKEFGLANLSFLPSHLLCIALAVLMALSASALLASMSVVLPDTREIVGFIQSIMPYLLPIFYSYSALPVPLKLALSINPLAALMDVIRDSYTLGSLPLQQTAYIVVATAFILVIGLRLHARIKDPLPDLVQ
jgi:ABC-type polysaccharide/polyol phosphate export permease